jgi:hypothetical protein
VAKSALFAVYLWLVSGRGGDLELDVDGDRSVIDLVLATRVDF